MSSENNFQQWKKTILSLEKLICIDTEYQERKAHDKELCDAVLRLSGVLGNYVYCYNEALVCFQQNLQVQKTAYMESIIKAVVARILELKTQLRKLEGSNYEYISDGLIKHKLTTFDAELNDLPSKHSRPENVQRLIDEAFQRARVKLSEEEDSIKEPTAIKEKDNWWETSEDFDGDKTKHSVGINIGAIYEIEEKISEETLKKNKLLSLIQAHERTRKIVQDNTIQKQKRILWEKELNGTLKPAARFELKERSAKIIQIVLRRYFEVKRKRIENYKLDELMGIKFCERTNHIEITKTNEKLKSEVCNLFNVYEEQRKNQYDKEKIAFLKQKGDDITNDIREFVRDWFRIWFDEVKFFYSIPKENQGGLAKILREEVPSPSEWLEECKTYLEQTKANKNKTPKQLKFEKMEAKREAMILKKEELRKKKIEVELLKKIMKNPNMHPGYHYPRSKRMVHLIEVIEEYKRKWLYWDELNVLEVKKGFVKEIDYENICAEVKEDICITTLEDMRLEFKKLTSALKEDYKRNDEIMPDNIKQKRKKAKKKRKPKAIREEEIFDKLYYFATKGIMMEYPITKFQDFLGEFNYAGDKLRCNLRIVQPFGGETRTLWWEKCWELAHGFRRILLVGPKNSGKTVLVHAMATVNNAILYELNPTNFQEETVDSVKEIVNALVLCAKTTQPSIIYIRHVHRLYYKKTTGKEAVMKFAILKKFFVKMLTKKIHKSDKITLIGSCIDPWLTGKQIIKHFPNVVLIPPTSYSTTQLILRNWITSNRIVPSILDVQSLAHMLQGFSMGYLINTLRGFLTPDCIIQIAAHGLSPNEIYEYFLQNEDESKVDYEKYQKWYFDKTYWGKMETKHLEEQIEFKSNVEKWKEKMEKKK